MTDIQCIKLCYIQSSLTEEHVNASKNWQLNAWMVHGLRNLTLSYDFFLVCLFKIPCHILITCSTATMKVRETGWFPLRIGIRANIYRFGFFESARAVANNTQFCYFIFFPSVESRNKSYTHKQKRAHTHFLVTLHQNHANTGTAV